MSEMINVSRAELFKMVRRPAMWVLLGLAIVLSQVFNYLIPYLAYRSGDEPMGAVSGNEVLAGMMPDQLIGATISGFPVFAGALALVFGSLVTGSEYAWGTVKTQLMQRPGRPAVFGGQLLALAVGVMASVAAMVMFSAVSSTVVATSEGQSQAWPGPVDLISGIAAGFLILLMWALLGATLGVLFRGVALPIGLGVVWVLGIENLVSAMASTALTALEPVRDVLPGVNAGSLVAAVAGGSADGTPGVTTSVDGTRALITLGCYLLVLLVIALWTMRRRDVV